MSEFVKREKQVRSSLNWRLHFEWNAKIEPPIPWDTTDQLTRAEREAVAKSVQLFQLGESGEGNHLLQCSRRYADRTGDAEYHRALGLFVNEEGDHADMLGRFLDIHNIERLQSNWMNGLFRWVRHLAGLELSIMVLVSAEVIAQVYYAALRRATDSDVLRGICERILKDESAHVRFQCERLGQLAARRRPVGKATTRLIHTMMFWAAVLVVLWSHRRVFRRAGVSLRQCLTRHARRFHAANRWIRVGYEAREPHLQADQSLGTIKASSNYSIRCR